MYFTAWRHLLLGTRLQYCYSNFLKKQAPIKICQIIHLVLKLLQENTKSEVYPDQSLFKAYTW